MRCTKATLSRWRANWVWAVITKPWHVAFMSLPGGFLWAGFGLASFNILLELPREEERTQATAAYTTLVNVSMVVGPIVGGWLVDWIGYRWDFFFSGVDNSSTFFSISSKASLK